MSIHKSISRTQVCELILLDARHLIEHGALEMYHLIV